MAQQVHQDPHSARNGFSWLLKCSQRLPGLGKLNRVGFQTGIASLLRRTRFLHFSSFLSLFLIFFFGFILHLQCG